MKLYEAWNGQTAAKPCRQHVGTWPMDAVLVYDDCEWQPFVGSLVSPSRLCRLRVKPDIVTAMNRDDRSRPFEPWDWSEHLAACGRCGAHLRYGGMVAGAAEFSSKVCSPYMFVDVPPSFGLETAGRVPDGIVAPSSGPDLPGLLYGTLPPLVLAGFRQFNSLVQRIHGNTEPQTPAKKHAPRIQQRKTSHKPMNSTPCQVFFILYSIELLLILAKLKIFKYFKTL